MVTAPAPGRRARQQPRRRLVLLLVVAAVVLAACSGGSGGRAPKASPLRDATYPRLDGTTGSFAEHRGKPVVVNWFAQSCKPCVTEMPALEALKQDLDGQVAFVGLNPWDAELATKTFVEQMQVTWDVGRDLRSELLSEVGGSGLPTTVVLNADGDEVYRVLGIVDIGDLRGVLEDLGAR